MRKTIHGGGWKHASAMLVSYPVSALLNGAGNMPLLSLACRRNILMYHGDALLRDASAWCACRGPGAVPHS